MGIFDIFKKTSNKSPKEETSAYEPKNEPVEEINPYAIPKPQNVVRYESVRAKVTIDDMEALERMYEDLPLTPDADYEDSKRDLIDRHEGERVWEYLPYDFEEFRLDDDGGLWLEGVRIGAVSKNWVKAIRHSKETHKTTVELTGGKYKQVTEDDVFKDETDLHLNVLYYRKKK